MSVFEKDVWPKYRSSFKIIKENISGTPKNMKIYL
jgi:hypothetical protein